MTRDEELIQKFESKTGALLEKAQSFLTTALPGGPGIFTYVVMSNMVSKLFGHTRTYVERAVTKPLTLPNFVYVEPLDEELAEFFEDGRFKTLRSEFPSSYDQFSSDDWMKMRSYYRPLYYTFTYRDPFMVEMFSFEIQRQNYKRIIMDFDAMPVYKQALDKTPSAQRQNALWGAVKTILKDTVKEVWSKDYAKQVFEEAKARPEVAELVEKVKNKIRERVNVAQLLEMYNDAKSMTGRSLPSPRALKLASALKALEYVTTAVPDGHLVIPTEVLDRFQLQNPTKMRVLLLVEED